MGCNALHRVGGEWGASFPGWEGWHLWGAGGWNAVGAVSSFLNGKQGWTCCFCFCEDDALLCRCSPGRGWGQTFALCPCFHLISCCVQGGRGCQGLWKFLAGLAESRRQPVFSFPILMRAEPQTRWVCAGITGNPFWHPKAATSQTPLDKGPGSLAVLPILWRGLQVPGLFWGQHSAVVQSP